MALRTFIPLACCCFWNTTGPLAMRGLLVVGRAAVVLVGRMLCERHRVCNCAEERPAVVVGRDERERARIEDVSDFAADAAVRERIDRPAIVGLWVCAAERMDEGSRGAVVEVSTCGRRSAGEELKLGCGLVERIAKNDRRIASLGRVTCTPSRSFDPNPLIRAQLTPTLTLTHHHPV